MNSPTATGSHRRRWKWAIPLGLLVVIAGAGAWFLFGTSSDGRQVDPEDAQDRLDDAAPGDTTQGLLRPAQGVYLYTGSGTETLNTPPREQPQGPEMPATVTHGEDGCWSFRIDYHSNHWQQWDYCPRGSVLDEVGGRSYVRWDFDIYVSETNSTFVCDSGLTVDPEREPGDEWDQACRSIEDDEAAVVTTAGPYRYVGTETLDIGGNPVEAYHYDRRRDMGGAQMGTERTDVWFSVDTGLPLRNERELEVRVDSIVGESVYTEVGEFEAVSVDPTE